MRCSTSFHSATSCAPKKFVARMPVANTIATVRMTPKPGICTPSQLSVRNSIGTSSSDWSSTSKMNFSTQSVMTSGIQMIRPVMKYFLTAPETKRPDGRRAGKLLGTMSVSGAGCAGAPAARRRGFTLGGIGLARRGLGGLGVPGLGVRGLGLRLGLFLGLLVGRLRAAMLEVGRIPAAALEMEPGGAHQLLQCTLAASRALG